MAGFFLIGTLPSTLDGLAEPRKWALFDLDWTLIRPVKGKYNRVGAGAGMNGGLSTNSNARLGTNPNERLDWRWLPGRIDRLKDFVRDDYTLGIVTNKKPHPQYPLEAAVNDLTEIHRQLQADLGVDVPIMAGTTNAHYRKPGMGWFDHLIALPGSLMVGDAAGRPCDFSDSDRVFAEQAGLAFYTPEEVFPNSPLPDDILTARPFLLIMMGAPASGKSTFASNLQSIGWTWISSDQYKSNFNRIFKAVQAALQEGQAVVIDATNPSRERRDQYRNLASSLGIPSAIVHMVNAGEDRNKCRTQGKVPPVAYGVYWKNYQEPNPSIEGPVYEQL